MMVIGAQQLSGPVAPYIALSLRGFLGLVFVFSVAGKGRSRDAYARFRASADHLARPLPGRLLAPATLLGEAAITLLLLSGRTAVAGFGCALALLVTFTVVLAREHRGGSRVPCQCFGLSQAPIGRFHLARNAVLLAAAAVGLALCWAPPAPSADLTATGAVVALVAAASAALLVPFAELVHNLFDTSTVH